MLDDGAQAGIAIIEGFQGRLRRRGEMACRDGRAIMRAQAVYLLEWSEQGDRPDEIFTRSEFWSCSLHLRISHQGILFESGDLKWLISSHMRHASAAPGSVRCVT